MFFFITPPCPVFPNSKSGENIQGVPGKPLGLVFRRGKPPVVPSSIVESSNSTSLCLSALSSNRVGSHERLGPCGDRPTPCCSANQALGALRLSNITLHSCNPVLQHNRELPTLSDAHRYVLVRPPAEDAPWSPSPPHRSPRPPPLAPP